MKILCFSDAHFDSGSIVAGIDLLTVLINEIKKRSPDLILIAGDMADRASLTISMIDSIEKDTGTRALFVPGNHDIWTDGTSTSLESYKRLLDHPSCLVRRPFELNTETVIIGASGWYDYSFLDTKQSVQAIQDYKKHHWADAEYANWGAEDSQVNQWMLKELKETLEEYKDRNIFLVTHVVPYKELICETEGSLSAGFLGSTALGRLIEEYKNINWLLFGHLHKRLGKITSFRGKQVICSPIGFVHEWNHSDAEKEMQIALTEITI